MIVFEKIKKLSPLKTYLIGSFAAAIAGFVKHSNIYIYYVLALVALIFCISGVVKYFSKSN